MSGPEGKTEQARTSLPLSPPDLHGLGLRLWTRAYAAKMFWHRDGHLIELGAFAVLIALATALAVPLALIFWLTPEGDHAVDRLIDACQQGVMRGPLATVGYAAGALLAGWAFVVLMRLAYRGSRDTYRILLRGRTLASQSREMECFAGGHPITVRVLDTASAVAFTAGLLRPRIYLSSALLRALSPDELEATLLHEATHVTRRDPLRCWLVELIVWSAWLPGTSWIPAVHRSARESRADVAVVRRLTDDRPLFRALLKVDPLVPMPGACGMTSERERALRHIRTHGLSVSKRDRIGPALGLSVLAALMFVSILGLTDWQPYWFCPDDGTTVA